MIIGILTTIGVIALALLGLGLALPNPDAKRLKRIEHRAEVNRDKLREQAARRKRGAS